MARRKTRTTTRISPQQATHALHVLISDGKVTARDVVAALTRREAMIHELRRKLAALEGRAVSTLAQAGKAVTGKARRKKPKLSAATRAKYRQQGHYLSSLRPLSKSARAKVKVLRAKSGVRAAIAAAKKMVK